MACPYGQARREALCKAVRRKHVLLCRSYELSLVAPQRAWATVLVLMVWLVGVHYLSWSQHPSLEPNETGWDWTQAAFCPYVPDPRTPSGQSRHILLHSVFVQGIQVEYKKGRVWIVPQAQYLSVTFLCPLFQVLRIAAVLVYLFPWRPRCQKCFNCLATACSVVEHGDFLTPGFLPAPHTSHRFACPLSCEAITGWCKGFF